MRAALKQAIADIIPPLKDRLYDVQPPLEGAEEPYGVIALGEEIWKSAWAGYRQVIRLKLFAGDAGLDQADTWAEKLLNGLHHKRVKNADDSFFTLSYLGSREAERLEPSTGKACRTLRFGVHIPVPGAGDASSEADEWLQALTDWTGSLLGMPWTVYHTAWPSGPEDSAVMWRMTGCETKMAGASLYEVRKVYVGHISGPDTSSEQLAAVSLIEGLGSEVQLPIDASQRKYMSVAEVSADMQADAFLDGQLRLTLVQRRMRPAEEAALIRRVDIHPILK
ncbi:hypothetical protein GRF59_13225 [Paenibacillus sp. HJL G12]|uniref:Uncharacterized protein n=1 Tax=Paenibacillus dendrobii TaxID=2691084 RepID=A0A7X3IJ11_9BACL|nr:hypothetical protein [Paenibacillus dendrobii]MWV44590.1 hypothetical protein [Paenibacillus dendrobii]